MLASASGYVTTEQLVDAVYGKKPPLRALTQLYSTLMTLRSRLPASRKLLISHRRGYRLVSAKASSDSGADRVLKTLRRHRGKPVTFVELEGAIFDGIAGRPTKVSSAVHYQIGRARKSLKPDERIENVWGLGFKLVREGGAA